MHIATRRDWRMALKRASHLGGRIVKAARGETLVYVGAVIAAVKLHDGTLLVRK